MAQLFFNGAQLLSWVQVNPRTPPRALISVKFHQLHAQIGQTHYET